MRRTSKLTTLVLATALFVLGSGLPRAEAINCYFSRFGCLDTGAFLGFAVRNATQYPIFDFLFANRLGPQIDPGAPVNVPPRIFDYFNSPFSPFGLNTSRCNIGAAILGCR